MLQKSGQFMQAEDLFTKKLLSSTFPTAIMMKMEYVNIQDQSLF